MFDTFTFQLHITDSCNSRCKHCYQDGFSDNGLPFDALKKITENIKQFVQSLEVKYNRQITKHINITGGEPLMRSDLFDLIAILNQDFSVGLLSNGSLITQEKAKAIAKHKIRFVQVSLDGNKEIHDKLRYKGSFDETLQAITYLKNNNVFVTVSFTINNSNFGTIQELFSICKKNRVDKLWFDRYIPLSVIENDLCIKTDDLKKFLTDVFNIKKKNTNGMQISMDRALQFLIGGNVPYQCKAGKNLLAILPDGTLLPCRRLPISLGNIFTEDLSTIYNTNRIILDLQNRKNIITGCEKCTYYTTCNGGLKCLTYAEKNNYNQKDVNCWI